MRLQLCPVNMNLISKLLKRVYLKNGNCVMEQKTYMADVYSKYWIDAREKRYGFLGYDKNLCSLICEHVPKGSKLFEVAIGTGYPFADFFQKAGYSLYGIDISPMLIEKVNKLYPTINAKVGDAENIEYPENFFDCTYCFHSTWYFPDLKKAIGEMIRVTCHGGLIIFDIQNRRNREIEKSYKKRIKSTKGFGRVLIYIKNIVKIILRKGYPDWSFIIHEVPTYPEDVCNYLLNKCKMPNTFRIYVRKEDGTLKETTGGSLFEQYDRLIFSIIKI